MAHSGTEERFIQLKQIDLAWREEQRRHLGVEKVSRPYSEPFVNAVGDIEIFILETKYGIHQALSGLILFLGKTNISLPLTFGCLFKILLDTNIFMFQSRCYPVIRSCSSFLPLADD